MGRRGRNGRPGRAWRSMSTDANARGPRPTLGHIRGLDGIRALSVLAIIAFHTGLNSVPGGFYGVDSFFVLSGFLITSLLVKEWGGTRDDPAAPLLGRPGPAAPAGAVPAGRRHRHRPGRRARRCWPRPTSSATPCRPCSTSRTGTPSTAGVTYFSLSSQPSPAAAHLVAGDRGAVLPGVAARRAGRAQARDGAGARRRASSGALRRGRSGAAGCCSSARARSGATPTWTRRRRLHVLFAVACLGSLASAAPHGRSWRPTATPPGPTTAPTPGPRRCWSARPSPSG